MFKTETERQRQWEKRQEKCPAGWMRNVTNIIPNNESGQNYQNQPFKNLDIFQRHPTNWEVFIQENRLNLGKSSGCVWWLRPGLPATHIHPQVGDVQVPIGQDKLWRLAAPLPDGVKITWIGRRIPRLGHFQKQQWLKGQKEFGKPVSQLVWLCHTSRGKRTYQELTRRIREWHHPRGPW